MGEEYPGHVACWNHDRYYHIPESALRHGGKNVIAVRILTNHIYIFEGRPFIADVRPVRTYNFFRRLASEYTAIGGQVNLAARLESACEPGGILISHSTRALVKDDITCSQREEKISVKGIRRELIVYDVVF